MQIDTALNVVWLGLGALALLLTLRAKSRVAGACSPCRSIALQICGVALIAATLFPYISATDDVLRIQHNVDLHERSSEHRGHSSKQGKTDALIRLFEAMDTPVVGTIQAICFTLFFVSFVTVTALPLSSCVAPFYSGRSPPLSAR